MTAPFRERISGEIYFSLVQQLLAQLEWHLWQDIQLGLFDPLKQNFYFPYRTMWVNT